MFKSLSWQEFLFAAGVLAGLYYAVLLLVLPRARKSTSITFSDSAESEPTVMGKIGKEDKEPQTSSLGAEGISFAQTHQPLPGADSVDPLLLGGVSDLLEEAKTLTNFIIENHSSKEEATTFLRTLLSKYPRLKDSRYQNAIELYLYNELKDNDDQKLSLEEIRSLWK